MELLIYPVSGIMKLWFLALHEVFGASTKVAWIVSLFGLIFTVRSIIVPFSYIQYRAGRIMVNLRPTMRSLEEKNRFIDTGEALRDYEAAKKDAMKQAGHQPAAGCVPALIQIPVFIGLYQVLLRMARPNEGLDVDVHQPIGFLTSADVASFLQVRFHGIPLPAHVRMTEQQYEFLGTDQQAVFHLVAPFFIAAAVFSMINMLYSLYRSWLTMDFRSTASRTLYKTFIAMAIITPLFPLSFGLAGPGPVALAFYWFFNSFWTMAQMVALNFVLDRRMPITPEFKQVRDADYVELKDTKRQRKQFRRRVRALRLKMVFLPHRFGQWREELKAVKHDRAEVLRVKQEESKRAREARSKAQKALTELRKAERKAKAQSAKDTQDTDTDADPVDSDSSTPANPADSDSTTTATTDEDTGAHADSADVTAADADTSPTIGVVHSTTETDGADGNVTAADTATNSDTNGTPAEDTPPKPKGGRHRKRD